MHRDERSRIIVLDDDPTGSQTVHSCLLLTRWDEETLELGFRDESSVFFVLTNTRAMSPASAAETIRSVCENLRRVLARHKSPWMIVSRSDSTLRGHYPIETDVINDELGPFDAHFLVPEFFEGGRITRNGMHYVVTDGAEMPVAQTEFARDSAFGFTASFLPDYVEEKTGGRLRAANVRLIGPEIPDTDLARLIDGLQGNACCAVSATNQNELDRIASHLLAAASRGKRFLFRSAASLLTSLTGLPPQPVAPSDMSVYTPEGRAGLVVMGSHVALSTRQLHHLLRSRRVASICVEVGELPHRSEAIQAEVSAALAREHSRGRSVAVYTSRSERQFDTPAQRLEFGREVSALLMRVVRNAPDTLGFIISKGGITSNDVLRTGLGLGSARVLGQVHPGCSVVLTPPEHRHGSIPVVIFPGNVGTDGSLTLVFDRISGLIGAAMTPQT